MAIGHADATERNAQALSIARAKAVQKFLVERGLNPTKSYIEGKAAKQPVASNSTQLGRAKNRRVELETAFTYAPGSSNVQGRSCNPVVAAIDDDDVPALAKLAANASYPIPRMGWAPALDHALRSNKKGAIGFLTGEKFFSRLETDERAGILQVLVQNLRFDLLTILPSRLTGPGSFPKGYSPLSTLVCMELPKRKSADEIVAWLIEKGHRISGDIQNALSCAIGAADRSMVVRLLELGADLNTSERQNAPPVFSSPGDVEFLVWLAARGAKFDGVPANGDTALHRIAITSPQVLDWLLRQGIDINARSRESGDTPLSRQMYRLSEEMVLELVKRGADILIQDNSRATPLIRAIYFRNAGAIRALLDAGADCHQTMGSAKRTLLHAMIAAKLSLQNTLERLERCGVDLLATDDQGNSALHLAAQFADAETLRSLVKLAYPLNAKNVAGDTPLHIAAGRQVKASVAYISAGPTPKPAVDARLVEEKQAVVETLIASGADRDALDAANRTPIWRISDPEGQEKLIDLLKIVEEKRVP